MANCPLYKFLKSNGTSTYVFPGASEDISSSYQNSNYKMYFSHYSLLHFPKQNTVNLGGTQSSKKVMDFNTFETLDPSSPPTFSEQMVESLRNYVANHEVVLRESRLNNTDYYYDTRALETTSEKIFFKWAKKLNLIDFEPAVPQDEYFDNLSEFERVDLNDDSYFPEYLWKEREPVTYNINNYYQSGNINFNTKLEFNLDVVTTLKIGDIITLDGIDPLDPLATEIYGTASWAPVTLEIINITTTSNTQQIIVDYDTLLSGTGGNIKLVYHRLVQYIGDVNGVSNNQEANRSYTEVNITVPDHTGQTPDILFRTLADVNYKPGLQFPILPNQYQPEILGAEQFSSPIVSNPQDYPGSYYGQFDGEDFIYETQNGDTLRRSGDYYGVTGDINTPTINGSTIDGINLDLNTDHYVKMNLLGREISTFDQFNALEVNNQPPTDFEFNAICWYYVVEDNNGNRRSNLYGISFLDNPENNPKTDEVGIKFPTYKKLVTNGKQDGTAYQFGLNINFNIINDNVQDAYNPEAINSLFSMNLYNEAMRRLSSVSDSFIQIIGDHSEMQKEISDLKQLLYTQTDLTTLNNRIKNLEELLKLYSTQQIVTSDTIEPEVDNSQSPSVLRLNNIDRNYTSITVYKTKQMYNTSGAIPVIITPPSYKNFMLQVINDDDVDLTLPDREKLILNFNKDLDWRQTVDILITPDVLSSQNKKLDIYINTIIPTTDLSNIPIQTLLIGSIDLPVSYNLVTSQANSSANWKSFNFNIDFNKDITALANGLLEMSLVENPLIVQNSIKVGDTLTLTNLFVGTSSVYDFSGQYPVNSVDTNGKIKLDISNNIDLISYIGTTIPYSLHTSLDTKLSNLPKLGINKGYLISITRMVEEDNVQLAEKYFIEVKDLQY